MTHHFWGSLLVAGLMFISNGPIVAQSTVASDIPKQNIKINADLFELDAANNQVLASGNVVVRQRDVTMTGDRATYDQGHQKIRMTGNIHLRQNDMRMTCDFVLAYGQKEEIEASGNVAFSFQNIRGQSEKAYYKMKTQRVKLLGDPIAWQGEDQISGTEIHVDLERGKVTTRGNAKIILSVDRIDQEKGE